MNISPLDIRKQTFRTVFRGADNEEVRVFLDLVASEQERLIELNGQLTERIRHCEDRLAEYQELDQTLRTSVLTAERHVSESRETAQREASLVLQEAEWRAKQMLEDARERLSRLSDEIRDLQAKKDAYVQHLRSFLDAQMELLGQNEEYLEGVNRLTDEVSAALSRSRRIDIRPAAPPAPARPAGRAPAQLEHSEADPADPASFPQRTDRPAPGQAQQERPASPFPPAGSASQAMPQAQHSRLPRPGHASQPAQTAFPPARGLSRFARPGFPPAHSDPSRGQGTAQEDFASGHLSAERSEGLFEISAEEEDTPRQ